MSTTPTVPALPEGREATETPSRVQSPQTAPETAQIRVPSTYTCGGCDTRWSGVGRAHCARCHRTFSTVGLFDLHRRDVKGIGTCLDPAGIANGKTNAPLFRLADGIWKSFAEYTPVSL